MGPVSEYQRRSCLALASMLFMLAGAADLRAQVIAEHQLPSKIRYLGAVGQEGLWAPLVTIKAADWLHTVERAYFLRNQQAFWEDDRNAQAAVAVQMIAQSDPYLRAYVRIRGERIWREPAYDPERGAPELNPLWLRLIEDRKPMPDFRGRLHEKRGILESAIYNLFCQAVRLSRDVPVEAFVKSAEDYGDVTIAHLFRSKDRDSPYRGKVIPIHGKLLRLRRYPAPASLIDQGITHVYEGWIEGPTDGSNPFCVIFPGQPEDKTSPKGVLEPAEKMSRKVSFYGYFIKLLPYPREIPATPNKTEIRFAPMLIGPTLIVEDAAPPEDSASTAAQFPMMLFVALFSLLGGVFLLIVGLNWWFRRGDRQFHQRLRELHTERAAMMLEDENKGHEPEA